MSKDRYIHLTLVLYLIKFPYVQCVHTENENDPGIENVTAAIMWFSLFSLFFSAFFFPAVTVVFRVGCLACSEDFSVVLLNYGLQVVCAAITYFYVVFVEDLVVPVIFRKMFTDEVQKLSADVCLYVHAVGRVKPNYVSLSVLAAVPCGVSCGLRSV